MRVERAVKGPQRGCQIVASPESVRTFGAPGPGSPDELVPMLTWSHLNSRGLFCLDKFSLWLAF